MDYMATAATAAITALVGGVVGALVATIIGFVKSQKQSLDLADDEREKTLDALCDGMRSLLWRELKNIHAEAVRNGGMTIDERKNLEDVYRTYHDGLNGNGTGTRLYVESLETSVLD